MAEKEYDILIDGLKKGNREIFDRIFCLYYSELVNYCVRFVNDDDLAEEIVQDVFVKLWIRHTDIVINTSLKSYLYRAVQNHALNYFNYRSQQEKYQQYVGFTATNSSENPLEKLQENDLKIRIEEALFNLPEKCREVFELRRFEGMKNKEIAQKMNISVKTVEKQISKAIFLLKKTLQEYLSIFLF